MVGGAPGTGKTTLAQQIAFHHARGGGRVLYLAALSETAERLVGHATGFSFFDPSMVADRIYYVSLYPRLEEEGLPGVLDEIRRLSLEYRASMVCIDGLATLKTTDASLLDFRRFIFDLNAQLRSLGATSLVLGPWVESAASDPELVVADGIVTLTLRSGKRSAQRCLEVLKLRGAEQMAGEHAFSISADGVSVYPRLETALRHDGLRQPPSKWTRAGTGSAELDSMLRGGIPSDSCTFLAGVPGVGRTTLALSFLAEGGRRGEPGIYLGFDEAPSRLVAKADALGLGLGELVANGVEEILWMPPLDLTPDQLAWQLLQSVDRLGARRVVIDGIETLLSALDTPSREEAFTAALVAALSSRNVTTVATSEMKGAVDLDAFSIYSRIAVFDNIIVLQYVEQHSQLARLISILKVRESDFDPSIREFTISHGGLHVGATYRGAATARESSVRWRGRRAR